MRFRFNPAPTALVLSLLAGMVGAPANADWLVTLDGDRVETRGAWEVEGKLVVFTLPDGTLSSMRLAQVDLDVSERLTDSERQRLRASGAEAPARTRAPAFVLTDSDVGHVQPSALEEPSGVGEARDDTESPAAAPSGGSEGLTVADWSQDFDDGIDGVIVTGNLENRGEDSHTDVTMAVLVYYTDGTLAGQAAATLGSMVMSPGQSTSFRVTFPGIVSFDRPEFRLNSEPLAPRAEESEREEGYE